MTDTRATPLRDSGLDLVGEMPWGTHFCLFYDSRQDLIDVLVPYLAAGLVADELCVWMPSDPEAEQAVRERLRKLVRDFDARAARGQVEFTAGDEWYRKGGLFDIDRVMRGWHDMDERVRTQGFAGLRASGDLGWIGDGDRERAQRYEMTLHDFIRGRRMMVLCTYPLGHSLAVHVLDSALAHHFVLARRQGHWESVETAEHKRAVREIERLNRELEQLVEQRTAELRLKEWYLAEGQRLTHSGSCGWDAATHRITFWSEEMYRIFGFEPSPIPPEFSDVVARVHPDDRERFVGAIHDLESTGRDFEMTFRLVLPDGRRRYVRDVAHGVKDATGRVVQVTGSSVDITERKRAAARLARARRRAREQALEARFAAILEERSRLAREIHDSLLQGVTGIALQLRAALPQLRSAAPATAESIRRIAELAEATARDARQTVWDMRPLGLAQGDLATSLEETVRRAAAGVEVTIAVEGEPRRLDPVIQDTILRVGQESTANAVKHSGTKRIAVDLRFASDSVVLTVQDFGRGFDVESASRAAGRRWGLLGMRERADRIGGSLAIRSRDGKGTVVTLEIPIASARMRNTSSA